MSLSKQISPNRFKSFIYELIPENPRSLVVRDRSGKCVSGPQAGIIRVTSNQKLLVAVETSTSYPFEGRLYIPQIPLPDRLQITVKTHTDFYDWHANCHSFLEPTRFTINSADISYRCLDLDQTFAQTWRKGEQSNTFRPSTLPLSLSAEDSEQDFFFLIQL
ncbi:hypothetical protein PGT21_001820 [Puccinia graminis f. sp. tritici]|uniref:Uncharacterized protein n=1 Tax=Puccinia graminis f. sp. tritici TaxID=56615 RepID=A0A5B0NT66_PUCGR|nr:hypothetical protein PGT21_001820 [Puccinia graminis f. sp. tritici]